MLVIQNINVYNTCSLFLLVLKSNRFSLQLFVCFLFCFFVVVIFFFLFGVGGGVVVVVVVFVCVFQNGLRHCITKLTFLIFLEKENSCQN